MAMYSGRAEEDKARTDYALGSSYRPLCDLRYAIHKKSDERERPLPGGRVRDGFREEERRDLGFGGWAGC